MLCCCSGAIPKHFLFMTPFWHTVIRKPRPKLHNWQKSLQMFRGLFLKKNQTGFRTILKLLPKNLVSNLWADIFIIFLFMKDFQKFWTKLSPKLAKFVWEVPYSVPYATGLDNGGKHHILWFSFHLVLLCIRNWIKPFWFFENCLIIAYS